MFINGNIREPEPAAGTCQHETASDPLCVGVDSPGSAFCLAASERCDGLYSAAANYGLLLPDGWIYTSVPDNCVQFGPPEINCNVGTETEEIPAVYSG